MFLVNFVLFFSILLIVVISAYIIASDRKSFIGTTDKAKINLASKGIPVLKESFIKSRFAFLLFKTKALLLQAKGVMPHRSKGYVSDVKNIPVRSGGDIDFEARLLNKIKLDPENFELHKKLAHIYVEKKKYQEARDVYIYLSLHLPTDFSIWFSLGMVYYRIAQFSLAVQCLLKAKSIDHLAVKTYVYLSLAYVEEKKFDLASEAVRFALRLDPDNVELKQIIKNLYKKQSGLQGN